MTDKDRAKLAAEWLKTINSRVKFYDSPTNPDKYPWTMVVPYIAGFADTHSMASDSDVIAEAKRLGWEMPE